MPRTVRETEGMVIMRSYVVLIASASDPASDPASDLVAKARRAT